jgi:hypothetical protein
VVQEEINEMSDIEFISRVKKNKKKTNRKEKNGQTKTDQNEKQPTTAERSYTKYHIDFYIKNKSDFISLMII